MVSKKILGVAIAAAFSSQAFAVIDLTGASGVGSGAVTYAKESVVTAQVVSSFVQVAAAGTELNMRVAAGFGVTNTNHAYVRFNLVNAKFKTAVTGASLTGVTANSVASATLSQGGQPGDNYVIFDLTAGTAGLAQADLLQLALTDLQVSPTAAASVYYTLFNLADASLAVAATGATTTGSLANDNYAFASVANVLTTTITGTDRVADVAAVPAFTLFKTPASATAVIGNVKFDLTAGALDAAGTAVTTLAQVMDTGAAKSKLEITTGDLSFTIGANAAATAANLKFNAVNSNTAATNVPSAKLDTLSGQALAGAGNDVSITATSAINAGAYSLTFTPVGITNAVYAPSAKSGALGTITRDGTSLHVAHFTTSADYNQRLVLVNRGADAAYSIAYRAEPGITCTAKSGTASGTLLAGKVTSLRAIDLVDVTGTYTTGPAIGANGNRCAATVTIQTPSANIDGLTTTVNPATKSIDSVKLDNN